MNPSRLLRDISLQAIRLSSQVQTLAACRSSRSPASVSNILARWAYCSLVWSEADVCASLTHANACRRAFLWRHIDSSFSANLTPRLSLGVKMAPRRNKPLQEKRHDA